MTLPGFLSPTPDKELQLLHLSYSDDLVAGCNDGNHRRLPTGKYTHTHSGVGGGIDSLREKKKVL